MKLNLGSGNKYLEGYVNIDIYADKVDVKQDILKYLKSLKADTVEKIIATNILEHIEKQKFLDVMKECHRVLIKNGELKIVVPHYTNPNAFGDPTHRIQFSCNTFNFFNREHRDNYYCACGFSEIFVYLNFNLKLPHGLFFSLFGGSSFFQLLFEYTPLHIFPAQYLKVMLLK